MNHISSDAEACKQFKPDLVKAWSKTIFSHFGHTMWGDIPRKIRKNYIKVADDIAKIFHKIDQGNDMEAGEKTAALMLKLIGGPRPDFSGDKYIDNRELCKPGK